MNERWTGKVTAVSPGRLIDVLIDHDRQGKPDVGTLVELVERDSNESVHWTLRELADVTRERDALREQSKRRLALLRELVDTFDHNALRYRTQVQSGQGVGPDMAYGAWLAAAAHVRQVVAQTESNGNETATRGGDDASKTR